MAGIVVVGGGLAGLVCAWRLHRAGHDVEVLEASPQIGGRARSESHGKLRIPVGAGFVTDGQRNVVSVAAALGLADRVVSLEAPGGSAPAAVLRRDRFIACTIGSGLASLRSGLLPPTSRLRLGRLAAELVRHRDRLDPLHPERAARLEDGEEMPRFVARLAGDAARDRLVSPAMSVLLGCEPDEVSAAFFLLTLRSLSLGAAPITFDGGLGVLGAALAAPISVRTGCEVFSVETQPGGARVRYRHAGRERSFLADAAVVAVPGPSVSTLCSSLTGYERSFFESVCYVPGISVNLALDEMPDVLPFATGFARGEGLGLRALFQTDREPGTAPSGTKLLTVTLADSVARRLSQAKDEEVAAFTLDALAKTPLGLLSARQSIVHRWQHARPIFPQGALSRLEHFGVRGERSPRLAFAGDYLVGPTVEGALTSGMGAASRVVQSLEGVAEAVPNPPASVSRASAGG
jgi:oxygen-dependent protoporphyrinogen oxidase